jgi:regulatory protein
MKDWGRKKIYYGLKEKQVSAYCINKALKSINEDDYRKTLQQLAEKKWESLKGEQHLVRKKKATDYLLQKGYEPELVSGILKDIATAD